MKRKGFLAALLGLVAAPALAKVKPEPVFPRFFAYVWGGGKPPNERKAAGLFPGGAAYVICESAESAFWVFPDGRRERQWPEWGLGQKWPTIGNCLRFVRKGIWKEITAAEAEALLKPKTVTIWKATCPGPSEIPAVQWMDRLKTQR